MIRSAEILRALGPVLPLEGLEIAPNPLCDLVRVSAVRPGLYRASFLWVDLWMEVESEEAARSRAGEALWRLGVRPGMGEEEADRILGGIHPEMRKPGTI